MAQSARIFKKTFHPPSASANEHRAICVEKLFIIRKNQVASEYRVQVNTVQSLGPDSHEDNCYQVSA